MTTSSHTTRLLALLAIAAALLSAPALADIAVQKYDHDQYMNSAYDQTYVCSCASTADYYDVTNVGDFAANFEFTIQTDTDWISLETDSAYLQPGETATVAVTLSPPCGLEQDPEYRVYSTSQYGRHRVADRAVTATVCESLQLQLEQHDNDILPCTPADFSLHVKNVAPYKDTYTISTDSDAVTLAQTHVELRSGEEATIPATAQYSCDVSGQQHVSFTAQAHSSGSTHTKQAAIDIRSDYEYTLREADASQASFCAEIETAKQLRVTNIADTPNTYRLEHSGPGFVSLSEDLLVLQPGQSKTVQLAIDADERHVGDYTSTVEATSEYGESEKEISVDYSVRDCYENQVTVTPPTNTVCAGWTNFTVRVENRGESAQTFSLVPEGDLFSEVSANNFALRPAEHRDVTLRTSIPDRDENWVVDLLVRQTPGLEKSVKIPVEGVSNAACTQLRTSERKLTLYTDEQLVPVILTNDGIEAATYDLGLESDVISLREEEVFLAPGEQAVIHLELDEVANVAEGQYVAAFTAHSDRATYREDFHLTVKDKGFFQRAYERVAFGDQGYVDWCLLIGLVLLVLALVLAAAWIAAANGRLELTLSRETVETAKAVLAALAVVFLAAALYTGATTGIATEYEQPLNGSNYSALYHEFPQNTQYDLDLSRYFFDPDEEGLTYTHSQPANLDISIEDSVARINPQRGYSGYENVVFTAQDPAGATADSPIMTVRVVGVVPTTLWQWISAYCATINYVLLALAALLAAGLFGTAKRPREQRTDLVELESGEVVAAGSRQAREQEVVRPVPPGQQPTQVGGDVVAGDKVTYVGASKPTVLVASATGKKVHRRTCPTVSRIPKEKRVTFTSEQQALEEGYSGCKICNSLSE